MNETELFRAMDGIADDILERSEQKPKRHIRTAICAAACVCVLAAAAIPVIRHKPPTPEPPAVAAPTAATAQTKPETVHDLAPERSTAVDPPASAAQTRHETTRAPASTHTTPAEPQTTHDIQNGFFQGVADPDIPQQPVKPMISSYGEPGVLPDLAVRNGGCVLSDALQGALNRYGSDANYRVLVELFRDGVQLDNGDAAMQKETDRLSAAGYITAVETLNDGQTSQTVLTLHATADQLKTYPTTPVLGCRLVLYDEYFGTVTVPETAVVNNGFAERTP